MKEWIWTSTDWLRKIGDAAADVRDRAFRAQIDVVVLEAGDHVLVHRYLDARADRPTIMPLAVAALAQLARHCGTANPAHVLVIDWRP